MMTTYLFVDLNIVRQTDIKYHWEMESQYKSLKDITTNIEQ